MTYKFLISVLLIITIASCHFSDTKIYQWRGKERKGVFDEKNLLKVWPENGPDELWVVDFIGNGYGSPTITEKEIFITGEVDSMAWLFCLDLKGNLIWNQELGREWTESYPGSRSAPTVAGDLVYVASGMGNLYCINRKSGKMVWSKDFQHDFQGVYPRFGVSEAVVADENKVFLAPGGKVHNVVALDRYTGQLLWSNKGMEERSGYNPGNMIMLGSRKIFVTFSAYHLMGFDAETGELLWTHLQENTPVDKREPGIGDTHSNNIVFEDGYLYYAAGDGNGGVKLELSPDGKKITEIWRNPEFDSYMGGIVKSGDYLYGCGTAKKVLKSIHAETGEIVDSLNIGTGAVILADQMLYYYNQRGQLSLVSFSNGKMKEISTFRIQRGTKEHFSHPVIKNGVLYQRHGNTLMAYGIRS